MASSAALSELSAQFAAVLRGSVALAAAEARADVRLEVLLLVDNSGSMVLAEQHVYEALVLLVETLRRAECRFAIGRFGAQPRMLKRLAGAFGASEGQQLLESMSFDEGTHQGSGLQLLVPQVWPATGEARPPGTRRLVLVITDGLTFEEESGLTSVYAKVAREHELSVGVVNIMHGPQLLTQDRFRKMAAALRQVVSHAANVGALKKELVYEKEMPVDVAKSLCTLASKSLAVRDGAAVNHDGDDEGEWYRVAAVPRPDARATSGTRQLQLRGDSDRAALRLAASKMARGDASIVAASREDGVLPFAHEIIGAQLRPPVSAGPRAGSLGLEAAVEDLEGSSRDAAGSDAGLQCWRELEEALLSRAQLAAEIAAALEDGLLSVNRYSRNRPSTKGTSLHMQGLIKAWASQWQYRKFMAAKTGGGRREYSVVVALDVSASMQGYLAECALDVLCGLLGALKLLGVPRVAVVLFDDSVRVAKTFGQTWLDSAATLVGALAAPAYDFGSEDAMAIEVSVDLMARAQHSGRVAFVISDGHSTSGLRLTRALARAEENGVAVVGLAAGPGVPALHEQYGRWAAALLPEKLPEALRIMESGAGKGDEHGVAAWAGLVLDGAEGKGLDQIWKERTPVFGGLLERLRGQREATLVSGGAAGLVAIDVCFVIDVTGSMAPFMGVVCEQLKLLVEGIEAEVKKELPVPMLLRFAVTPFRDVGESAPALLDFEALPPAGASDDDRAAWREAHIANVSSYLVGLSRQADGGGDLPEDLSSAMQGAAQLAWSKRSRVKFAILVTDAPGHGPELCPPHIADARAAPSVTMRSAVDALLNAGVTPMLCTLNEPNTRLVAKEMTRALQANLKDDNALVKTVSLLDGIDDTDPGKAALMGGGFHFIFCLDESGSMGSQWPDLVRAYTIFLDMRKSSQSPDDLVTVVQFGNTPRVIFEATPIARAPRTLNA